MPIESALLNFPRQLSYSPEIINAVNLSRKNKFIVCGLGGSALPAGLLKIANPYLDLLIHRDYGLPRVPDYFLCGSLLIFSSYSGNTAEVIDALHAALSAHLDVAIITSGGALLKIAESRHLPHIIIPDSSLPPRLALGYAAAALLKIIGAERELSTLSSAATFLNLSRAESRGRELATLFSNHLPIIYASTVNFPLAYAWKTKINETAKIPAFANVFPELNHNEIESFDPAPAARPLTAPFHFIFLHDPADSALIKKRADVCRRLFTDRHLPVTIESISGENHWAKIFESLLVADWLSLFLAKQYGAAPAPVPLIEEFKKLIN